MALETASIIVTVDQANQITVRLLGNEGLFLNLIGSLDICKQQIIQKIASVPGNGFQWTADPAGGLNLQEAKHNTQTGEQKVSKAEAVAQYYAAQAKLHERLETILRSPDTSTWDIPAHALKSL